MFREFEEVDQGLGKRDNGRAVAAASGFSALKGGLLLPIVNEKRMDWKSKKLQKPEKYCSKLRVLASTGSLGLD
jgi:hypothetical protein